MVFLWRTDGLLEFVRVPGTRVALSKTLVTNSMIVATYNALGVVNEIAGTYIYINTFNPEQPLSEVRPGEWEVRDEYADLPAVGINVAGAELFATRHDCRLPTVREWQAAAGHRIYPWGDQAPTPDLANYAEHVGAPTPVGTYPKSGAGWFDLAGNVAEWCRETLGDPTEFPVAGGGWNKPESHLCVQFVRRKWRRVGTMSIGFRCARE